MHGTMAPHARLDVVDGDGFTLAYNPENPDEYVRTS
jgi:hypothetical protein